MTCYRKSLILILNSMITSLVASMIYAELNLNQYAPRKYGRGNHMPFINKTLSKEIIKRTKLRNKFLKDRTEENKHRYASQRNYCVSLLKKTKKEYFGNLNENNVCNNKTF